MNAFKLSALEGIVKIYGGKLFEATGVDFGVLAPGSYSVSEDGETIEVQDGEQSAYIRLRSADHGKVDSAKDSIQVLEYAALRDADGDFDGKAWSIAKGTKRAFANIA